MPKNSKRSVSQADKELFELSLIEKYLPKLIRAGQRVAICEQLEDPKLTKKIVKRGVTELVTPGVSYNDLLLDNKQNNFLATVQKKTQLNQELLSSEVLIQKI